MTTNDIADIVTTLIGLLADEAPREEIRLVERAVQRHARGQHRALLLQAVEDAKRVHDILSRRKGREKEAQALYATARELTSLRDVDELLTAIVDRVRQLLATDSTYIALLDEQTGEAYMRVTSGTMTEPIRSVRQGSGWGVGGLVIQTGRPFATSNYLADPGIRRDPAVARAVAEDGVVSIVGVPMKLGHRVIGALFAADRRPRTFDQPEIALLSSLAQHAAVIIDNARLYARIHSATRELREVHAQLSRQRRVLELAAEAHESLMPPTLAGAGFSEFTATLARILHGSAAVVTGGGEHIAQAAGGVPPETLLALECGDETRMAHGTAAVPLRAGGEIHGHLLFGRAAPLTAAETRTLERAAQTATLLLLLHRQTTIAAEEFHRELLADLLAEQEPDEESFRRRAGRFGSIAAGMPWVIVVLSTGVAPTHPVLAAAGRFAADRDGLAGEHALSVVVLLPGVDAGATARAAAVELSHAARTPVTAGAAGPAAGLTAIRNAHRDAVRAQSLLHALGREGDGAAIGELGIVGASLAGATRQQLRDLVDRALGTLLDYDARHGAALLATAECYFGEGQSPAAAARRLGVHVNTLYQRIERIDTVLGGRCWRLSHGALNMQVALQLYRMMPGRG